MKYQHPDISQITPDWVKSKLDHYDLTARELGRQIGTTDDAYLSSWFSGARNIGKTTKAAIWQFFERIKTSG